MSEARSLTLALLLCACPATAQSSRPAASGERQAATERWYEIVRSGSKLGYTRVVWAPSTWRGKKTVHDTTTVFRRSVRDMAGTKTVFETSITIDLERSLDGTLWQQKTFVNEAGRLTTEELVWSGKGYTSTAKVGGDPPQSREFTTGTPVMTDCEAALSQRIRQGKIKVGQEHSLRLLDERRRAAREFELKVALRETIEGLDGPVECLKVLQRDPESGVEDAFWLDGTGAFVRIQLESGTRYQQVTAEKAKDMPVKPAQYSVTTPSTPPLERIFNAKRMLVDLHLQGDPSRPLPDLPTSPWSRVVSKAGSDEEGWVLKLELRSYDDASARTTLPLAPGRFSSDLEPTPLMPSDDRRLKAKAMEVLAGETNMREAAHKLARYVHGSLAKESPDVGSTTALEILEQGKGDCSEHCVLFVALCRAAGIPARRCTGYVNIGSMWGAHAWAEIWVGEWIGADPTTGEVGCAARYVFFGYPDRPGSYPGVISNRVEGRMRFVSTRVDEGARTYDLTQPGSHRRHDPEAGVYVHALAGIEVRGVPDGWRVRLSGDGYATINAPGMTVSIQASGDQGYTLERFGGANGTYAGAPARVLGDEGSRYIWVHSRRRLINLSISGGTPEQRATLEKVLADTFAPSLGPLPEREPTEGE